MTQDFWMWLSGQLIAGKIGLRDFLGMHDDALQVHFSLLLLFGAALILRRRPDSLLCWLIVFALEMVNEFADLTGPAAGEGMVRAAWEDIFTTMFWPTVILLLGRILFPPQRPPVVAEEALADPEGAPDVRPSGDLPDQPFEKSPAV
ncbi:MAG: hypothetical protein HC843_06210 [Sphingomonadales bacterium]|nr:hypothetical protein [Sphingomonadales bacterium]